MSDRKKDHIDLTLKSQVDVLSQDKRFYYEPALGSFKDVDISSYFLGKKMGAPIWVSSMTGGTTQAEIINQRLAISCGKFKLGMGLGSCRVLLKDFEKSPFFSQFNLRSYLGDALFYANLGIAQIYQLIKSSHIKLIEKLVDVLQADGLIIHINPLQEYLQPEGDRWDISPIDIISKLQDHLPALKIIVKEVGQGFGPKSLKALFDLEVCGIELAGFGGTNFSKIENFRAESPKSSDFIFLGHTNQEMITWINQLIAKKSLQKIPEIIISGGIKSFSDGHYYRKKLMSSSTYGMASKFLENAKCSQEQLDQFIETEISGLKTLEQFTDIRD